MLDFSWHMATNGRCYTSGSSLVEVNRDVEERSSEPLPEWMTAAQLARYWQLGNANGEPITAGIMKWTKRAENEHPLPHACMGDLLRFKREEVGRWAQEEAAFRREEKNRRTCISRVKTVTGFTLLIEWQRSDEDECDLNQFFAAAGTN